MIRLALALLLLVPAAPLFAAPLLAAEPEVVQFKSLHRDGATLRGFLLRPDPGAWGPGPYPTVLLLHGCSGPVTGRGQIAARERAWMNLFVDSGYVVLLADSFNPRGYASICSRGDRPITAEKDRPYDAYAALGWLHEQSFVNPAKVAVMGWSHGAMTALAAISDAMIQQIAWTHPGFLAAVAFYPGCFELSKTSYDTEIPLLMQLGERDDWTPVRYCQRLMDAARTRGAPIEADIYPGAFHAFDNPTGSVRTRMANSGGGDRVVRTGANPAARSKAIARVQQWLVNAFGK